MPRKKTMEQLQRDLETSRLRTKKIEAELKDLEKRQAERAREEHRDICAKVAEHICGSIGLTPERVEADGLENFTFSRASEGSAPAPLGNDSAAADQPTLGI